MSGYQDPLPNTVIASACLLSFPFSNSYVAVQLLHDSSLFSYLVSGSPQFALPTVVDLNFELGPAVACLSPSEVFWLSAMITQITKLFEAYSVVKNAAKADDDSHAFDTSATKASATLLLYAIGHIQAYLVICLSF